jgi:hypothetical protein
MADDDRPSARATSGPTESNAALLSDILGDVHSLVSQQFQLTRQEIVAALQQRKAAAILTLAGAVLGCLAGLLLSFSAVHGLHEWMSPPGRDHARFSLPLCYLLVSGTLFTTGGGLLLLGRQRLRSLPPWQPLPVELFQEPPSWTKPRP